MNSQKTTGFYRLLAALAPLFLGASAFANPQTEPIDPAQVPFDEVVQPQPVVPRFVDKQIVGWRQAETGVDGQRIGTELRANWVVLNENHGISGQIVGATGPVTLHLLRNGFLASRIDSDEFGNFEFEAASAGVYTLVGRDRESFFAYGFIALENTGTGINLPLIIRTLPVNGLENFRLIAKLVRQNSASVSFSPYGVYDIGETPDDPAEYFGFEGLKDLTVNATPSTTIQHQPVTLQTDGRFIGRIHQVHNRTGRPVEVRNTSIKIIQNGELVAEAQTDVYGVFEFAGLSPGNYGLVAVGADGIAAVGIELVAAGDTLVPPPSEASNASYSSIARVAGYSVVAGAGSFDCLLCDPEAIGWINAYVQEEGYNQSMNEPRNQFADQPMPFDYFGNGGSGGGAGGGGGFGLGGIGELLLTGAIGVAIADAATSGTDFGGGIVLPVSPFFP